MAELAFTNYNWAFLSGLFSIVLIDLLLAGDNAMVIAMAVRSLPKRQRRAGIIYGSAAAVLLRVFLTFFVAQILTMSYVKLAAVYVISLFGFIIWIGLVISWIFFHGVKPPVAG